MLTTRERVRDDRELRELEELWTAPAALEPLSARPSLLDRLPFVPGWLVAGGWAVFFLVVIGFEPAPEPQMAIPLWADLVFGSMLVLLFTAAFAGRELPRLGFGAATVAGALGMAIAVACQTSGHHMGNWWLFELAATGALFGAAATGLVDRLRR
jgi:hypothetical protein